MCLEGQVLDKEGVHGPFKAHMEFCYLAFRQRKELDAVEPELLEQSGDVFLIPGETIERFGDDKVKCTCASVLHKALEPRP